MFQGGFFMLKNNELISKPNIIKFSISAAVGILVTVLLLFIFAVIFTFVDLKSYVGSLLAIVALSIGAFVSGYIFLSKEKEKGFLKGLIAGLFVYIIVFIGSLILSDNGLSLTSLFHLICASLAGAIAGIIQVNKQTEKKYLK